MSDSGLASQGSGRAREASVRCLSVMQVRGRARGDRGLSLLGSEARKALQIFVQSNDCSGRC